MKRAGWIVGLAEQAPAELARCASPIEANAVAIKLAAADAGLPLRAIDVVLSYDSLVRPDIMQATRIADYLGIAPHYASTVGSAGATPVLMVGLAASMIRSGMASTVAIAHSDIRASGESRAAVMTEMAKNVGNREFEDPFGPIVPTFYSFFAEWLLAEGLTTPADLATIAVTSRAWAAKNPNAHRTTPLTVEQVLDVPRIAGPFGRYDCCLITDFSGALIVAAEPTRPRSAQIVGVAGAATHEEVLQLVGDDPMIGAKQAARRLYEACDLGPEQLDAAFLYDSFTVTVAMQILAYGLDRGHGLSAFLTDPGIGPDGGFPINTHGGLLSGTTSGLFHIVEAVRQLRGSAGARQRPGLRTALVANIGGAFSNHCAAILRADDE